MQKAKKQNKGELDIKSLLPILVIILLCFAFVWYFYSYQKAKKQINQLTEQAQTSDLMTEEEVSSLLAEISELMILPDDQGEPMVATIKDVEKLKTNEPFYAKAENEDKLLIYQDRAIIYSPTKKKIVNVGPVYMDGTEAQVEVINLDVRNGSQVTGVASEKSEEWGQLTEFEVVDIKNAANEDYEGMILVNLTGKDLSALESMLGVQATSDLPEGESSSTADVVVIIGN